MDGWHEARLNKTNMTTQDNYSDATYRRSFERKLYRGGAKHECPTCKRPNALTDEQKRKGYQCDKCADLEEGCGYC